MATIASEVFADTAFYIALVRSQDDLHQKALDFDREFRGTYVTTDFVLIELGNWLAEPPNRTVFVAMLTELRAQPRVRIISADADRVLRGLELYEQRTDKGWSVTDCISFVVMKDEAITQALTADHHFEQAGFEALLK